ncbi:serine/threonine protein kinase [Ktedonospora formicarum]|nr:serine/threonine-protein kinase [Ktedonospora formicarum]
MTQEKIHIDGYDISTLLFQGPYTVLYEGRRQTDSRDVLLKLWPTAPLASEHERESIQREIEHLRTLNEHPHMLEMHEVRVGDFGIALITDAAPLGTLQARLTRMASQPFPQEEAYALIEHIGGVLSTAHSQGMIHANLSSQNVVFRQEGQAALTDFHVKSIIGTIKNYQGSLEEGVPRCWYMAPEQFQGYVDAFSDQYALGCLAYVVLTGRVPFFGTARATLSQQQSNEAPDVPSHVNPALPSHIDSVILRALSKDPSQRFPDVEAFLQALREKREQFPVVLPSALSSLPTEETQAFFALDGTASEQKVAHARDGEEKKSTPPSGMVRRINVNGGGKSKKNILPLLILAVMTLLIITGTIIVWQRPLLQMAQEKDALAMTPAPLSTSTYAPTGTATGTPTSPPNLHPSPTTTPDQKRAAISPFIDCVQREGGTYAAYFGYANTNSFAVSIPQGANNYLSPTGYNGVQPGVFQSGRQYRAFRVPFKNGTVIWNLDGGSATASRQGPDC